MHWWSSNRKTISPLNENYVRFFFGSVANLTDRNKNYVDLLEGANLLYNETYEEENETDFLNRWSNNDDLINEDGDTGFNSTNIPYIKYINNLIQIIKFVNNLDDESNFKLLNRILWYFWIL